MDSLFTVFSYLLEPVVFDAFKRLVVVQIKGYYDPLGTFIVCTGDGPESFLSGRVPDLQLDQGVIDIKGPIIRLRLLKLEIDSNGGMIGLLEVVVRITFE